MFVYKPECMPMYLVDYGRSQLAPSSVDSRVWWVR